MRIALVVDNPCRDLPGLVLLAMHLCQEGVTCYLVPFNLQNNEIWFLNPDFVLLNYLRRNNESLAETLAKLGIRFGVLDTEGAPRLEVYVKTLAPTSTLRYRISCYCCWGAKLAEHLNQEGWYRDEQIMVTGAPRFDFYVHPWREAALRASPYAETYPRPIVLIMGNFPLANPRFTSPEQEGRMMTELFGYNRSDIINWQNIQRQTLLGMVNLANNLAMRFAQVTFVYRPHPFERLETYLGLLEQRDNLHLVKMGTVDGWLLRASAVIHRSCFTAVEAGIAGIPAFQPGWIPTSAKLPTSEAVSIQCETEKELSQTLESVLTGNFVRPAYIQYRLDEVIHDWFFQIDGRAHERVAECILRNLPTEAGRRQLYQWRNSYYGLRLQGKSLRSVTSSALKKLLGLPNGWSFRRWDVVPASTPWEQSEKFFDAEQVRALIDAIQVCVRDRSKEPPRKVGVLSAQERGDYHSGYLQGRSVTVFPE